jgi:hypothetical protein
LGVPDSEFSHVRSKVYLTQLFEKIGYKLEPHVYDVIYDRATQKTQYTVKGVACIQDFRDALNDYLDEESTRK